MPFGNGRSPRASSAGASGNVGVMGLNKSSKLAFVSVFLSQDSVCVTWDNLNRRNINYLISTGHTLGA